MKQLPDSNGPTFSSFLVRSLRPMRAKKGKKGCWGWENVLRIERARRAPAAGSFLSQGYGPLLLSILFSFSLLLSWFVLERLSDTRSISLNWARNYDSGRRRKETSIRSNACSSKKTNFLADKKLSSELIFQSVAPKKTKYSGAKECKSYQIL